MNPLGIELLTHDNHKQATLNQMALHLVKVSDLFAKDTTKRKHMGYLSHEMQCKIAPVLVIQILCA